MKATLLLFAIAAIGLPYTTRSQELFPLSAHQLIGTGGTGRPGLAGSFDNPAAFSQIARTSIQVFGASRFIGLGWQASSAVVGLPLGKMHIGLAAHARGATYFRETGIRLSWAKQLSRYTAIGLQTGWISQRANTYEPAYRLDATMGIQFKAWPHVYLGAAIGQIPGFIQTDSPTPSLSFGCWAQLQTHTKFNFSITHSPTFGIDWRTGIQYQLTSACTLMGGLSYAAMAQPAMAFSWTFAQEWTLLIATQYHPQLGWTPAIELQFAQSDK